MGKDSHFLVCNTCDTKLKTTANWSTSTIINHLRVKHSIANDGKVQIKLTTRSFKPKATQGGLDLRLVQCIVKDMFPVSFVSKSGLVELIQYLAPDCIVASRYTIVKTIHELEGIGYDIVAAELKKINNCHITTDAWSDRRARGFGSLTVSYIDDKWKLKTIPAKVARIKGRHTAEKLASWLTSELESYQLEPITMTTDNASAQKNACEILISNKKVLAALRCTPHVINLVVRKVIESKDVSMADLLECDEKAELDEDRDDSSIGSEDMDELTK